MRPRRIALAIAALFVSATPASANHPSEGYRHVGGAILAPGAPGPEPEIALRCGYLRNADLGAGTLGWVEKLRDGEDDGRHRFALLDGRMGFFDGLIELADYDIAFYASLGSCDGGPPPILLSRHDGPWNEQGSVPAGARYALIWLGSEKIESAFELEVHPPAE